MAPNSLGPTGLTTATQAELITYFTAQFQTIYGVDIDLSSSTPDGQLMNIIVLAILDLEDLLTQINNMFDPDNAVGVILDQRVAINGIQRQAGTFTVTNVTVTVAASASVNLYGLDQDTNAVYTVQDAAGNLWELKTTQLGLTSGAHALAFQASVPGALISIPNTITIPVTIVLGVSSVNNPTTYTSIGTNEESDALLKLRRQQSVSLASQGYLPSLIAALLNVPGVSTAFVYENLTSATDLNGVPGHSIWVIIGGSPVASAIANVIYQKRNAACGMYGGTSYTIAQVNSSPITMYWDYVSPETLYIRFTATSIDGINQPKIAAIRAGLVTGFVPAVNQEVNVTALGTAVQVIDPNTLVTSAGFSLSSAGPFTNTLNPTQHNFQFAVSAPNIIIIPTIVSGSVTSVATAGTATFTTLGGYGAYTYSLSVNNSGGSIVAGTGVYTAGATPSTTDTILSTDGLGNTSSTTIQVT